ncbi:sterol desaturase family protein [Beijerinckia indica]|uniref:sterol desaturase family protein n=1 Tax=Beijerinckia indica TaxID=533 RepID=UPI003CC76982
MSRLAHREKATHDLAESASSLCIAVGNNLIRPLEAGLISMPFIFVYDHRLIDFASTTSISIGILFLATEFQYYWQHRCAHRIRWMWATHAVHHSPTKINLTAAIRLGWTSNLSGNFLFFLPLAWIGFHPVAIAAMLGSNLLYQFFIHTELAPRLGPLEWVLNTPAHHRVHHASNSSCLDKNYGGVLILFDRLFGTFAEAPTDEALRYGLHGSARTLNPFHTAFDEWVTLAHDLKHAPSFIAKLRVLFSPPGSAPSWRSSTHDRGAEVTTSPTSSCIIAGE